MFLAGRQTVVHTFPKTLLKKDTEKGYMQVGSYERKPNYLTCCFLLNVPFLLRGLLISSFIMVCLVSHCLACFAVHDTGNGDVSDTFSIGINIKL